jgi:diguanylate cyclase (GGDEF)-like protein/PAS domain S-box-containing protein
MSYTFAVVYWAIVCIWILILLTILVVFSRKTRSLGSARVLLFVVAIDSLRNIIEDVYFSAYLGSLHGLLPSQLTSILGLPYFLIIPKIVNVGTALTVLWFLVFRWLPSAQQEKASAETSVFESSEALAREVDEHRRFFETSADLIVVTDKDRVVVRISDSCFSILGYRADALLHRFGGDLVAPADFNLLKSKVAESQQGNTVQTFECSFQHRDGHDVPLQLSTAWSQKSERFFLIGRDMTASKAAAERLDNLAFVDQLTQLPNRASLIRDYASEDNPRFRESLALAILNLDGLKDVNDTWGHTFGDELLRLVGSRLTKATPPKSAIYRFGSDEFVLVIAGCRDPVVAKTFVDVLLHQIQLPCEVRGRRLSVSASAGIAFKPANVTDLDEVTSNADLALRDAKASGRRTSRIFLPAMRAEAQARIEMERELHRAARRKEFVLHFQPQLRLSDETVVGAEALLRWNHPSRGLLSPDAFIDALGRSAVASDVGRWIIEEACRVAANWNGPLRVAVNLFPSQFRDGTLLENVEDSLQSAGLPPERLEVEVTENVVLGNANIAASLAALKALGVRIAFDDFGTGFASLSCISEYPLTCIKIDRSFIQPIHASSTDRETATAEAIITLAHKMGLSVVAEGVETGEQVEFLRSLGCDEVQGYLYSRPLTEQAMSAFIASASVKTDPLARQSL